MKSNDIGVR